MEFNPGSLNRGLFLFKFEFRDQSKKKKKMNEANK